MWVHVDLLLACAWGSSSPLAPGRQRCRLAASMLLLYAQLEAEASVLFERPKEDAGACACAGRYWSGTTSV